MTRHYLKDYPTVRTVHKENELLWLIKELLACDVQSLLSIGLLDGGTEWHIARMYKKRGKKIDITGIDNTVTSELNKHIYEIIINFGQSFTLLKGDSHSMAMQESLKNKYDAVLIDGDHSYLGVKKDFELALRLANKVIALHDIVDSIYHTKQKCFVSKLWGEIKESGYTTREVAGANWAGIGIVYLW